MSQDIELLGIPDEDYESKKRRRSCLYFFKLETAMVVLTLLDVLMLITYFRMSIVDYEDKIRHHKTKTKLDPVSKDQGTNTDLLP